MNTQPTPAYEPPTEPVAASLPEASAAPSWPQGPAGNKPFDWNDSWHQATPAIATIPVRPERHRLGGPRLAVVAALCVVSALSGAAGALGAAAVIGHPAAATGTGGGAEGATVVSTPAPGSTPAPVTVSGAATTDEATVIQAASAVSPAVVTIQTGAQGTRGNQGQISGTGSGVIIGADGWILTNHHVVGDASTVTVILADGRTFQGTVKGVDTLTDFAIVKIDATGLPTATLGDSASIQVGQRAIVIGNPLGEFPGAVTVGVVSGLDRDITVADPTTGGGSGLRHLIQTDASINPGNSGGALIDSQGRLIGITTAEASQSQGIGFALPIDLAKPIIAQVEAGKSVARPWIGITYQSVDAQLAQSQSLDIDHGAWIHAQGNGSPAIASGSPAEKAGLKDGDIITAIDGISVDAAHPLDTLLLAHAPGDHVTLSVLRGNSALTIDLTLGTRPANLGAGLTTIG